MPIPVPTAEALGRTIRSLRQRRDLTIEGLAEAAGINHTYLSDIERGLGNPTLGKLSDLAQALQVRLSEIIAAAEDAHDA